MSSHYHIFIRTDSVESQLIADIEDAAHFELKPPRFPDEYVSFVGETREVAVEVELSHDYDDDGDMYFSQYPVVLNLRSYVGDRVHEEAVARDICQNLFQNKAYSLLLVFDMQILIATYER